MKGVRPLPERSKRRMSATGSRSDPGSNCASAARRPHAAASRRSTSPLLYRKRIPAARELRDPQPALAIRDIDLIKGWESPGTGLDRKGGAGGRKGRDRSGSGVAGGALGQDAAAVSSRAAGEGTARRRRRTRDFSSALLTGEGAASRLDSSKSSRMHPRSLRPSAERSETARPGARDRTKRAGAGVAVPTGAPGWLPRPLHHSRARLPR